MDDMVLTPEQEQEAARIADVVLGGMRAEVQKMARVLVSKKNGELLGPTEFRIRDACHRVGARLIDAALEERKKRGIKEAR